LLILKGRLSENTKSAEKCEGFVTAVQAIFAHPQK
jgi:hypothetical protein